MVRPYRKRASHRLTQQLPCSPGIANTPDDGLYDAGVAGKVALLRRLAPREASRPAARGSPGSPDATPASPPRDALAGARPVGEPCVARAIGQAFGRRVAAETKIRSTRGADRPTASLLAQFQQRTAMFSVDRPVVGRSRWRGVHFPKHLVLLPRHRSRARTLRGILALGARCVAGFFPRETETGELADDGVAAHPDLAGDFAAG